MARRKQPRWSDNLPKVFGFGPTPDPRDARIVELEAQIKRLRRVGRAAKAIPWLARSLVSIVDQELYEAQAALEPGDLAEEVPDGTH